MKKLFLFFGLLSLASPCFAQVVARPGAVGVTSVNGNTGPVTGAQAVAGADIAPNSLNVAVNGLWLGGYSIIDTGVTGGGSTYIKSRGTGPIYFQVPNGITVSSIDSAGNLTASGTLTQSATLTAAGTTGSQTINKPAGSIRFAASASPTAAVTLTDSFITATSIIHATVATNDTTMSAVKVVCSSGAANFYCNAAPTVETEVRFTVENTQ